MSETFVSYDKELPEIPDRCAWLKPDSFLIRDKATVDGWRVDISGRRPTKLLLVKKLREAVDQWRLDGYPGASDMTHDLFRFWFEEEHNVRDFSVPFRFYFGQREAIETLAYVVEVVGNHDAKDLIERFGENYQADLHRKALEFQTTMDGQRQVNRYVADQEKFGLQDLPPEGLRRYAFKMATGSGKTWVMAMAIVWSHFHRKCVNGSDLSTNFLIVAPNVIVFQRLEKDFASNRIFNELPLIPPGWGPWQQKVVLREDAAEPDPTCNLFLTNIQQLYEGRGQQWTPANAVQAILGPKPSKDIASGRSMLDRVKGLRDLVVINDEAHHVHRDELAWAKSLLAIHKALPRGLALWLDMSATPRDQSGMHFPWIVCDYPLAQAVEDRIVKAPIIVTCEDDPRRPKKEPDRVTKENIAVKYHFWIEAAVKRWKVHRKAYALLGINPVLFIMTEKSAFADVLGAYLWKTKEFGFKESEVLIIHTDSKGEITKASLELARKAARDIDQRQSKIKAIVSVMMLREGWDVRNVSVVLGLRPFTAKAEILPEQVVGRGLRLMLGNIPDRTQTLEVLGTGKLLDFLKQQLELEGVGFGVSKAGPAESVWIQALQDRAALDIAIPITKPRLRQNLAKLEELDALTLGAVFEQNELPKEFRQTLMRMEFAPTATEIHTELVEPDEPPPAQELLSAIATRVTETAHLTSAFADLYRIVKVYVQNRCFGKVVDLDSKIVRAEVRRAVVQDGIVKYLARKIGDLTIEQREIEFEKAEHRLSNTLPFPWRRNLPPPLVCARTIFNYVATYNDFERAFAKFLDAAKDVARFASLGTTEQGDSGTQFRVDYLKPSGAIGFYHPDWVAVQTTPKGDVHWILETKGRVWEGTTDKDAAIDDWCKRVSDLTKERWEFRRVNQTTFESTKPKTLAEAVAREPERHKLI